MKKIRHPQHPLKYTQKPLRLLLALFLRACTLPLISDYNPTLVTTLTTLQKQVNTLLFNVEQAIGILDRIKPMLNAFKQTMLADHAKFWPVIKSEMTALADCYALFLTKLTLGIYNETTL